MVLDWREDERERLVGVWVGRDVVLLDADMVGRVVVGAEVGDGCCCLSEVGMLFVEWEGKLRHHQLSEELCDCGWRGVLVKMWRWGYT